MKILALSDSHGRRSVLEEIVGRHRDVRHIFFLGDGLRDTDTLPLLCPEAHIYRVAGNCDFFSDAPDEMTVTLDGVKIFCCHGHTAGVKRGLDGLYLKARQQNAALALYGHTHIPNIDYHEGRIFVNPGSAGSPTGGRGSYAVIEIANASVRPEILYCDW